MNVSVEQVSMPTTAWLRQRVLRPSWTPAQVVEHDDPGALQVAVMDERQAIACANVRPDPAPWDLTGEGWWRVRGVATDPSRRREGWGATVVSAVCDLAVRHGGTRVWCNARTGAVGLYRTLGWSEHGDEFELPEIGPHVQMWRPLP